MPCVCVGGSYRHHLPRTGGDGDQAIRDAAKSLLALGHRRIVYPLHNAYGVQMVASFRAVMEEYGVNWNEAFHAPHWKDHAANFFPMLGRMFASTKPPTAFLTLGVRNLLPVLTWLGHHGLRVPEDVSLIDMIDDPAAGVSLSATHPLRPRPRQGVPCRGGPGAAGGAGGQTVRRSPHDSDAQARGPLHRAGQRPMNPAVQPVGSRCWRKILFSLADRPMFAST